MNDTLRAFRDFFVSLKLTVVLLVLGMILVFAATLDQVNLGIWAVQEKYFRSFFVLSRLGEIPVPVFPGGYLIGGILLINLLAGHIYRFKFSWKKSGIFLTHAGLILLLIGELLSGLWQQDYTMKIANGETKNYAESVRENELAIVETTDPSSDDVVAIPERVVARNDTIQHPKLPFRVAIKAYYPNANVVERTSAGEGASDGVHASEGFGQRFDAVPAPITSRQDERNIPAAYVELVGTDRSLGTWLVYAHPNLPPQHFTYAGRSWKIVMRFERVYEPFSLTLVKFSHDIYPGTDIPKNFSSLVRLKTPDGRDDREVRIYMNNPLRYGGKTFYQADYDHEKDQFTVLQVVRNPSWQLPYVACAMMAFGLIVQFGIHLFGFVGKRRRLAQPAVA